MRFGHPESSAMGWKYVGARVKREGVEYYPRSIDVIEGFTAIYMYTMLYFVSDFVLFSTVGFNKLEIY